MRYNGGMILKKIPWAACALLLASAGGCVSNRAGGVGVNWLLAEDADGSLAPVMSATLEDKWLSHKIDLVPMGLTERPGGFIAMNKVESLASRPLDLEYRIDWLDGAGAVLPFDFVLWHSFTLLPGESRFLGKPFPPGSAGYRVTIRRPQ